MGDSGSIMPCDDRRARKEKAFSSFLARTQSVKSHELCVYSSPSTFFFHSPKAFSFPYWGVV